jgi:hypothetical protein
MNWVKGMLSSSPETHPLIKRLEKDGPNATVDGTYLLEKAILDPQTPLWVINHLLRRGAKRDVHAWTTLLHDIILNRRRDAQTTRELVRVFVENGFDPNAEDIRGVTPLYRAVDMVDVPLAKVLIRLGADPFHPSLDRILNDPDRRDGPAFLRKARELRSASDTAKREFLVREAITQHAEATPLDETGRRMTGIPPGVPGPSVVKQFLTRKGGRKSTARHRKKSRRRHR